MPSHIPEPALEVSRLDDHMAVRILGCDSLNEMNTDAVGQQLSELIANEVNLRLVLHLDGIQYATSSALGKLIGLNKALNRAGGELVLLNPAPGLQEILSITRLDTVFRIDPPLDSAGAPANSRA